MPPLPSHAAPAPVVVSLIVNMFGEEGHPYPYNLAVGAAARELGWDHLAAFPTTCRLRSIPPGWRACLEPISYHSIHAVPSSRRQLRPGLRSIFRLARSIVVYLRQHVLPRRQPAILFVEFFYLSHLLALTLALCLTPRRTLSLWLLYRIDLYHRPTSLRAYQFLNRILRWLLGAQKYRLLADSDPLAQIFSRCFGQTVHVMPIPHSGVDEAEAVCLPEWVASPERAGKVVCWWPGGVRGDKGLDIIRRMAAQNGGLAERICLVAAQGTQLTATPGGCRVKLLPAELPREAYLGWLQAADLILLPYEPKTYAERTSGIFVEAIAAGRPAAVTAGTWMAGELQRYDLSELILDWDSPRLFEDLIRLADSAEVRSKTACMRAAYRDFHSEAGYARAVRALYNDHDG